MFCILLLITLLILLPIIILLDFSSAFLMHEIGILQTRPRCLAPSLEDQMPSGFSNMKCCSCGHNTSFSHETHEQELSCSKCQHQAQPAFDSVMQRRPHSECAGCEVIHYDSWSKCWACRISQQNYGVGSGRSCNQCGMEKNEALVVQWWGIDAKNIRKGYKVDMDELQMKWRRENRQASNTERKPGEVKICLELESL